jgi:hypothetical protein
MNCTHLAKGKKAACRALEKAYKPSLFQLGEYCRSDEHRKCPFYLRASLPRTGRMALSARRSLSPECNITVILLQNSCDKVPHDFGHLEPAG